MARLPLATRESVPESQREFFDEIVQGVGSVPRYGPGSVMVHVPQAHRWVNGKVGSQQRLRGLCAKVVVSGTISAGDEIVKVPVPAAVLTS